MAVKAAIDRIFVLSLFSKSRVPSDLEGKGTLIRRVNIGDSKHRFSIYVSGFKVDGIESSTLYTLVYIYSLSE